MKDYKDNLAGFANRLNADNIKTPIQQVKPIIIKEEEVQLNVELPKSLLKVIKKTCLEKDLKIKEFVIHALQSHLNSF